MPNVGNPIKKWVPGLTIMIPRDEPGSEHFDEARKPGKEA